MPHASWIAFLNQQDAPQNPESLSAPATERHDGSTLLIALTQQSLISLDGPDAEKFLQGQLTCDINALSPEQSLLGANCTHKGMVISVSRLFQRAAGHILMRLPLSVAETAMANLKKFAVFSKVAIELADETWVGMGLLGESAVESLKQLDINPPTNTNQQWLSDELIVVRVPGNLPRFELWCPESKARQLWLELARQSQVGNYQAWQAAEIEAGLVQLQPQSLDSYIPQMLNLQAVNAIGFSKGCYTGQEVVARLQFRGKLKKLLYAATVNTVDLNQPVSPETSLFNSSGRNVGKVLDCVVQQQHLLLQAIIGKAAADANDLHLFSADGPAISLLPLPYSIDAELFERPER
jgi:folate-binding protein YgfZ